VNYKALQDEVIALRFYEGRRDSIKSWLNVRYAAIWNLHDWYWKHVIGPLTVTGGNRMPAMPPEFSRSEGVYDNSGQPLEYMEPDQWRYHYEPTTLTGTPEAYTVFNDQYQLGPTPDRNLAFTHAYERRLAHVDATSGVIGGTMQEDGDETVWPAEWDYLLVVDTTILGMQLLKDDGYRDLVPQRDELLHGLRNDGTGRGSTEPVFWGGG
jgi:hypothetical protein